MKFSIIIPVYNAAQNLSACLDSVLKQTYRNLEMILVDDGSTDESGTLCDQYAKLFPSRVRVVHNENQGQVKARACGIANATGDVVLFVDSDDCLRIDALELLETVFEQNKCDMVLFNASMDEQFSKDFPGFDFENGQRFSGNGKKVLLQMMITTPMLNPLWLKATRTDVVKGIDERFFTVSLKNAGDLWFSMPMLSAAKDIVYLDQNLYYYRSRPGSIVHSYNPQRHRSIKKVHQEMERFIDQWEMPELHPVHYAREVHGWVECLKLLLHNERRPNVMLMQELAEDAYFRNAYGRMAGGMLFRQDAMLGKWLYEKKYRRIELAGVLIRTIDAMKRLAKGYR